MSDEVEKSVEKKAKRSEAETPPGHVSVSEAEFNRVQAELRKLRTEAEKREAADRDLVAKQEREAAEARGQYDKALAAEQAARKAAEERAANLARETSLFQEITRRGFGGEQAAALVRLTDSTAIAADGTGADSAVEAALSKYPALFGSQTGRSDNPTPPAPTNNPAPPPARQLPPSSTGYRTGYETIDGFVSMEEYARTPQAERLTSEFQARVARSEPYWPSEVPASSFAMDS